MSRKTTFFRYVGGILLVAGTTIGAGMLALPVATAVIGFVPSLIIFALCWLVMLVSAFFFLDVNLSIEGDINLITMAKRTLGSWGKILSWIVYLLLLYSLIAAYIAASAPIFTKAISVATGCTIPSVLGPFILPLIFGWFIYLGTAGVDWINKILMVGLGVSYLLLIIFVPSHVDVTLLQHHDMSLSFLAISVVITSFGYHIIIPSLTTYMNHDRKHLVWTLIIGSFIPLGIYIVWEFLVLGVVPLEGKNGLIQAWLAGESGTEPLAKIISNRLLGIGAQFFSFFAIVTSFLGVALSLSDFLTDGIKLKKTWEGRLIACLLTFVPPLGFVFYSTRGFIVALEYAGVFVAILLIFLPAAMAWHLKAPRFYKTKKAKVLIIFVILFAFAVIAFSLIEKIGYFDGYVNKVLSGVH